MAEITDFMKLDMRIGEIISVEYNDKALKPAYKLRIDFGEEIGIKNSSAQLCENYQEDDLLGRKVISVVNFPPGELPDLNPKCWFLPRSPGIKAPSC
ncbi:tRNA-binding protein [Serratia marcescens]|uniref:tRNA-binding protein n=1 Tax=Serratia marcescens TaxID=615 RepID=UPI0030D04DAE